MLSSKQHIGPGVLRDYEVHVLEDLSLRPIDRILGVVRMDAPIDHRKHVRKIVDQGTTNSCLAQACAASICTSSEARGFHIEYPSAAALWALFRLLDGPKVDEIQNIGCRSRSMCVSVQNYGVLEESAWPFTDENCWRPPPLHVFQKQIDVRLHGWYRATTLDEVIAALNLNHIPVFGMDVDASYFDLSGSKTYEPAGDLGGGHAQAIVGWDGERLIAQNSWGTSWGDEGYAYLSPEFFKSKRVFDVMILPTFPTSLPYRSKVAA